MAIKTVRPYIFNRETLKIELHFSREEYNALSEEEKRDLNSNFLWSRTAQAWVSRAKEGNLWRAKQTAEKIGFTGEEKQADFNKYRKDWSWLTQPIIPGHAGSRAFANHKEKVMRRYEKGFEEYEKSAYYQDRAATARATADNVKLSDAVYLSKKIKEQNKKIKNLQAAIAKNENTLHRIQQGEVLHARYSGEVVTAESMEEIISENLEKYDYEYGKLEFFEKCLNKMGGIAFSQENIKPGYIVRMIKWGRCEIISAGPVNVQFKTERGDCLTESYAAVAEILDVKELPKVDNPFKEGDVLTKNRPADGSIYKAYQVVKTTATGVKIQQIVVEGGKPIPGQFIGEKAMQKKVVKSKFSDWIGVYDDDWQLNKYTAVGAV